MMRQPSSDWIRESIWLRCFREVIGEVAYHRGLDSLKTRTREKWQPDDRVIYYSTLERERRLGAECFLIKNIYTGLDHGTAGDATEEFWVELLQDLLPQYEVVLKGVIAGTGPLISPQIDILIVDKNFPKAIFKTKVYPIESVVAAFECKLSLRLQHIKDAVHTAKLLNGTSSSDPIDKIPIFYGVLALSSDIENKYKPAYESVLDALAKHHFDLGPSLCMVDAVLSLNSFCLAGTRTIFCYDVDNEPMNMTFERVYEYHDEGEARPADSALGLFIQKLLSHLAKSDSSLANTRKMYDLFTRYPLGSKTIITEDLSKYISAGQIEKISRSLYPEETTVYSLNI
ncbi:DUF6602 domain-containing protein [Pseudomonas sp. G3-39]|jgi:hypothetical protein